MKYYKINYQIATETGITYHDCVIRANSAYEAKRIWDMVYVPSHYPLHYYSPKNICHKGIDDTITLHYIDHIATEYRVYFLLHNHPETMVVICDNGQSPYARFAEIMELTNQQEVVDYIFLRAEEEE